MPNELNIILDKLSDIKYGFVDKYNNIYTPDITDFNKLFDKLYFLQSPDKLINNKYGVCFDQVELTRYYLNNQSIISKTYFICNNDITNTHTFIVVKLDKYYWIEHAWFEYAGIHEYDTLDDLLNDIKNKFINYIKKENVTDDFNITLTEYSKPKYNLNSHDFINYCLNSKII